MASVDSSSSSSPLPSLPSSHSGGMVVRAEKGRIGWTNGWNGRQAFGAYQNVQELGDGSSFKTLAILLRYCVRPLYRLLRTP